jgi:hypothetical protein
MRQGLKYSAVLIGLYLLVAYSTGSGRVIKESSAGASNLVKAFQGRGR